MPSATKHNLTEDDIYRTSTQYRFWSFSPEQLSARRKETHRLALQRAAHYTQNDACTDHLTLEEELRLVTRYCELLRTTSDHLKWPANIKSTAIQYLRRFYLSNSCMTYPPKEIYKTVLFLASKTEAFHITLSKFCSMISADSEAVLAPEYKVMQALRFTLDVRQPFRGLKGVLMELINLADEEKDGLADLKAPEGGATSWTAPPGGKMEKKHMNDRVQAAYAAARNMLDAPASLTDAYFLYTPSQILLASLLLADEPLYEFYLGTKLTLDSPTRPKIIGTIQDCAQLMSSYDPKASMTKEERAELEKKLEACRDPSTKDMVKNHAAMKLNADDDDSDAKRKKAEKQQKTRAADDVFGPSLGKG
ncbi:cyclin ccl1 like protein [Zymoseptoria brevis]|uniref:RNA polymerase II holoenzyme cyclin-like subunit n=1 Tax=Zymoseptoria brevis TaxID=1047168 RepID=A0A0F4G7Z9_9PEZI|nr:cyclin ccl1 like protein [Zymoseptoria brevis]